MDGRADPDELDVDDRVRWEASGGTAYGEVEEVATSGTISAEPEGPTMEGGEDDPAFGVRVYDINADGEWEETDVLTVHRAGALTIIDDFPEERMGEGNTMETIQVMMEDMRSCLGRLEKVMQGGMGVHGDEGENDELLRAGTHHIRSHGQTTQERHASIPVRVRQTKEDRQNGTVTVEINNDDIDRHGTVVMPSGARTENYERNPVVMWQHGNGVRGSVPIGRAESIRTEENALFAQVRFDEDDEFAREIERKVEEGFVNAASIGFRPLDQRKDTVDGEQVTVVDNWELVEFSMVSVPSNPTALVESRGYVETIAERVADAATEKIRDEHETLTEQEVKDILDSAPASPPAGAEESRDSAAPAEKGDAGEESGDEATERMSADEAKRLMAQSAEDHIDRLTGRK